MLNSPSAIALSKEGVFSQKWNGFNARLAQQEMAFQVENAINTRSTLVAESGTGTGKTFAYLVPAIQSGKKIIVSTGTKHLQDQLFIKDLPSVREVLGIPCSFERLKGRANYLCLLRLGRSDGMLFKQPNDVTDWQKIQEWAKHTTAGDISELTQISDDSGVWPEVTSTSDNCLGQKCDHFSKCHVYAARKRATKADLVVVNHHLFFSDMAIKGEGFGEVLPDYDGVIFDEAHLLPEIAAQFFGFGFSTAQVTALCREIRIAEAADKSGVPLSETLDEVEKALRVLLLAIASKDRGELEELDNMPAYLDSRDALITQLGALSSLLESASVSGENLASVYQRTVDLLSNLQRFAFPDERGIVYWYESTRRSLRLQATPVTVSDQIRKNLLSEDLAMVFTSATLTSEDDGAHYCQRMGLDDTEVMQWGSPYDYRSRSLMYVPDGLPDPSNFRFSEEMVKQVLPVLELTDGHCFLLFTSYRVLHEVREILAELEKYPLVIQGEAPKHKLIERFHKTDRAVLLGTSSFWEGVDVKGDALICVVIDKLPFASPFDPVNKARLKHIEDNGGNSFYEYQLPQAILTLKQGVGRLIRDELDFGVLMICDPRIRTKSYGQKFLNALPPMRRTTRLEAVSRFLSTFLAKP